MKVCSPANSSFPNSKVGSPNLGLSPGARSMPGVRGADSVLAPSTGGGAYPVHAHSNTEPGGTVRTTGPSD
jgi:hypothetical protein